MEIEERILRIEKVLIDIAFKGEIQTATVVKKSLKENGIIQ